MGLSRIFSTACVIGGFVSLKAMLSQYNHPIHIHDLKCDGKTYVVTGATGKLGMATTYALAARNARVIMACRDMDKCKVNRREIVFRTGNRHVACRKLDLTSLKSINEFVDHLLETEPRIDCLINNAAVSNIKNRQVTYDGFEMNLGVNYLGPYFLTMRLADKLLETAKAVGEARIVNVTGLPAKRWHIDFDNLNMNHNYHHRKAYEQSKLALALFTRELAVQFRQAKQRVFVYGTHPGGRIASIDLLKEWYIEDQTIHKCLESIMWILFISEDQGAAKNVCCAISKELAKHKNAGKLYGRKNNPVKWVGEATNEMLAKRIWLVGEKWTKLDDIRETMRTSQSSDVQSVNKSSQNSTEDEDKNRA